MLEHKGIKVLWLKHAGFLIQSKSLSIVIDPYGVEDVIRDVDILLISHTHADHLEQSSIEKVVSDKTEAFCSADAEKPLKEWTALKSITPMKPNETREVHGVTIKTYPAYNLEKEFHPKEKNWLGFLIEIEGTLIYFAGDTDPLKELESIQCDIGLFPVSGIYVMDAIASAELANKISPKVASIPMHWGSLIDDQGRHVGTEEDAQVFCNRVKTGKILTPKWK